VLITSKVSQRYIGMTAMSTNHYKYLKIILIFTHFTLLLF